MLLNTPGVDPGSVQLAVWIDKHIPGGGAEAEAPMPPRYPFLYAGLQEGILDRPGEVLPRMTCLRWNRSLRCGADVPFCLRWCAVVRREGKS